MAGRPAPATSSTPRPNHFCSSIASAALDQFSHWCATRLTTLTIEDLNVEGMKQLRKLAKAVSDAGMGDPGRLITYKADWYGLTVIEADRWFPSSKTCSACGRVKTTLSLSQRVYRCDGLDGCGFVIDRDLNAAVNLAKYGARTLAAATAAALPPPPTAADQPTPLDEAA